MGMFIQNVAINCPYCGHFIKEGRVSSERLRDQILTECRWVCDKCGNIARCDEKYDPIQNETK